MNNNKNGIIALLSLIILGILALVIFILVGCSEVINHITVLTETTIGTTVSTTLETETTNSNTTISTTVLTTTKTGSSSSNSTSSESNTMTETVISYNTEPVTTKDEIISIPYDIIVVTDPPITNSTAVETTVYTTAVPFITTSTITDSPTVPHNRTLLKVFPKGTYYCYEKTGVKGGSGRTLIDCSIGENTGDKMIKGSIACRYLYDLYCYNKNGRTTVYIEVPEFPQMNGHYYLDDCNGSYDIVDFFYYYASNCPFQYQGVISNISVYIDD